MSGRFKCAAATSLYLHCSDESIRLQERVVEATRQQVAKWAGVAPDGLELTSFHPIRVYYNQSTLVTHVDQVDTHVLSAVYVVDADLESEGSKPWLMETDPSFTGEKDKAEVLPGKLFLYESANLPHGRTVPLQSAYSAHIFVHFKPKDWAYTNIDRVYGVPPAWDQPALHQRREL